MNIWIRLPRLKLPQIMVKHWRSSGPLERHMYGHPLAGLLWVRQFEKFCWTWMAKKYRIRSDLFVHRKPGSFLSVCVDDIKMVGGKQNVAPMWKKFGETCGSRRNQFHERNHCQSQKETCSNHEFLLPQLNYCQDGKNLTQKTVAWSHDMEGHAKECVERYCELANKKTEQLYIVSKPGLDNHNFKKEELETVGELSDVCSQIILKCFHLARIGRPYNFLGPWSSLLAQSPFEHELVTDV